MTKWIKADKQGIAQKVELIVRQFLQESGARASLSALSPQVDLERDLGFGSLERAELFHRIENAFDIQLSNRLIVEARQIKDIVHAVIQAEPRSLLTEQKVVSGLERAQADPSDAQTLVDVLQSYAAQESDRPHIYLRDEKGAETIVSYGYLFHQAQKIAQGFINQGLQSTETVAIMLPTSVDFFYVFFGTLLAGGVPVPIYPPFRSDQIEEYAKREALILRNAGVRFLVTFQSAAGLSHLLKAFIPSLLAVVTVSEMMAESIDLPKIVLEDTDAALIQYTSGSTGNPKGVLLSHRNLLANMRAYGEGIEVVPQDVAVSWLPLYHDMGLIGAWLGSLYYGVPLTVLSPLTFLSRPESWLWAIHYHRATLSAGPNFASGLR